MRRLMLAALFCTSALVPLPSKADPASITAFFAAYAGDTAVAAAVASAGTGLTEVAFSVGAFLGTTIIGQLLVTVGFSYLVSSFNRPHNPASNYTFVGNFAQAATYMRRGYGRVKINQSPFGFTAFADNRRHNVLLIAAHSTVGPVEHWLDKTQVTLDGSGNVTTDPMAGYGSIRTYTGQAGQAVDATLLAAFPGQITSAFDFAGLSYAAIYCQRCSPNDYSKIYTNGKNTGWDYVPVWDMNDHVYDPRTATYGWTDNLALIIAAEAQFYGKTVDWTNVAEEADVCDQTLVNGDGNTQKRWTAGALFDDSQSWETVRNQLALVGDVWFSEGPDGQIIFKVGAWSDPTITLTDQDFLSVQVSDRAWGPDISGEFQVTYTDPLNQWKQLPAATWVEDAGKPRQTAQIPEITNHNQAVRVEKRMAKVARARYSVNGTIGLMGYELRGQRFVRFTHTELGYDFCLEIGKLSLNPDGVTFTMQASSTSPADFAFDSATEEPARPLRSLPTSTDTVPVPASLSGTAVNGTSGAAQIEWTWPAQDISLTQQVRFRCTALGLDWQIHDIPQGSTTTTTAYGVTTTTPVAATNYVSTGLADGQTYDAQVRNKTGAGRLSDWSPSSPISVVATAYTTAPGDLVSPGASASGGDGLTSWTAPDDAEYYGTRIWRADASTLFTDAVLIHTEYGARNAADSWTDVAPGSGAHSYWMAPINPSGVQGTLAGPFTITLP